MATLTSTGVNCSNGTLDGFYTGTTMNNSSFPIGSYVWVSYSGLGGGAPNMNNSYGTIYSYNQGGSGSLTNGTVSSGGMGGATALAGTWKGRGAQLAVTGCGNYSTTPYLAQRTA